MTGDHPGGEERRGAQVCLRPLPLEISESSRLGLITPEQFARALANHVRAEMRRNGDLTVQCAEERSADLGSDPRITAVAVIVDLIVVATIVICAGQL